MKELDTAIRVGKAADNFLTSELGEAVIDKARISRERAIKAFLSADPVEETDKVREAQNEIKLADRFVGWLEELIMEGENALYQKELEYRDAT